MATIPAGPIRNGLNDEQRKRLADLETVSRPSEWSRGELAAIRACATLDSEQARIARLAAKWTDRR
jgi:hypothetical protein